MKVQIQEWLFSILGLTLFIIATYPYGLGLTDDSVNYLAAASGEWTSFKKVDGTEFVEWPLLYPILLSFYQWIKVHPMALATVLNGSSWFLSLLLINTLFSEKLKSPVVSFAARTAVAFSTPLILVHVFLWSEGIFTLLLILALFFLNKYLSQKKKRDFFLLVLFSALMSFQRKSGIMVCFSIFLCLIVFLKQAGWGKRILLGIIYTLISGLPFLFYILRRRFYSEKIFTESGFRPDELEQNALIVMDKVSSWLFPDELSLYYRLFMVALIFSVFFLISKLSTRAKHFSLNPFEGSVLIIFMSYLIILLVGFTFVGFNEEIDDRILSPAYLTGLIFFFLMTDNAFRKISLLPISNVYFLRILFNSLLIIWLVYPVVRTLYHVSNWNKTGPGGYNTTDWRNNELLLYMQDKSIDLPIYTNRKFAVYYYLGIPNKAPRIYSEKHPPTPFVNICFECDEKTIGRVIFTSENGYISINGGNKNQN